MAKRGRKPKTATVASPAIDHAKLLKQFEQEQIVQLQTMYKSLAKIRSLVEICIEKLQDVSNASSHVEATFEAGRAYQSVTKAHDKLEQILDEMYDNNDLDYYTDIQND